MPPKGRKAAPAPARSPRVTRARTRSQSVEPTAAPSSAPATPKKRARLAPNARAAKKAPPTPIQEESEEEEEEEENADNDAEADDDDEDAYEDAAPAKKKAKTATATTAKGKAKDKPAAKKAKATGKGGGRRVVASSTENDDEDEAHDDGDEGNKNDEQEDEDNETAEPAPKRKKTASKAGSSARKSKGSAAAAGGGTPPPDDSSSGSEEDRSPKKPAVKGKPMGTPGDVRVQLDEDMHPLRHRQYLICKKDHIDGLEIEGLDDSGKKERRRLRREFDDLQKKHGGDDVQLYRTLPSGPRLRETYFKLYEEIATFALKYFQDVDEDAFSLLDVDNVDTLPIRLRTITSKWKTCTQKPEHRPVLMQAYFWKNLERVIFSATAGSEYDRGNFFWDQMTKCFERTAAAAKMRYPKSLAELGQLKGQMYSFVGQFHTSLIPERDAGAVDQVFGQALLVLTTNDEEFDPEGYYQEALDIIHKAADLDMWLKRTMHHWRLGFKPGKEYEEGSFVYLPHLLQPMTDGNKRSIKGHVYKRVGEKKEDLDFEKVEGQATDDTYLAEYL